MAMSTTSFRRGRMTASQARRAAAIAESHRPRGGTFVPESGIDNRQPAGDPVPPAPSDSIFEEPPDEAGPNGG